MFRLPKDDRDLAEEHLLPCSQCSAALQQYQTSDTRMRPATDRSQRSFILWIHAIGDPSGKNKMPFANNARPGCPWQPCGGRESCLPGRRSCEPTVCKPPRPRTQPRLPGDHGIRPAPETLEASRPFSAGRAFLRLNTRRASSRSGVPAGGIIPKILEEDSLVFRCRFLMSLGHMRNPLFFRRVGAVSTSCAWHQVLNLLFPARCRCFYAPAALNSRKSPA